VRIVWKGTAIANSLVSFCFFDEPQEILTMANSSSGEKVTSTTHSTPSSNTGSPTSSHANSAARDTINMARDSMSSIRDTARDSVRTARDAAAPLTATLSDRMNADEAREMMNRAGEQATEFYDQAQGWMRDNSRMLYMVGGFLAVGIVGYVLGRSFMNRSDIDNY